MKCFFSSAKICLPILLITCFYKQLPAQKTNWQNWNSIGWKIPVGKKLDFKLTELASFSPSNGYKINFTQTSASVSIDVSKVVSLNLGDQLNYIPNINSALRNRIFVRATITNKFSKAFKTEHALQVEFHDKNENRYQHRYIIINSISTRRRLTPMAIRPSLSYSLYYNAGGKAIQYYDKTGNPSVAQTPDGFHRGRIYATLNSKLSKHSQLSLYYMNQKEFNFLGSETRNINVVNPSTGKISRSFDDYNVIGLSFRYAFKNDN